LDHRTKLQRRRNRAKQTAVGLMATACLLGMAAIASAAGAQVHAADAGTAPAEVTPCNAPVPAHAEGPPIELPNGGYCYQGPHPVDTTAAAGPAWDNSPGRHTHFYPPLDLRLFAYSNDCYRFIGDPEDFGFDGQTQAYYGTHPIPDGGWCFMTGGHHHQFDPWSPQFVMVGPWLHWQGDYDASFWTAWPYYSAFHKDLYPRFYGAGKFQRDHKPAPKLPPGAWTRKGSPPPLLPPPPRRR